MTVENGNTRLDFWVPLLCGVQNVLSKLVVLFGHLFNHVGLEYLHVIVRTAGDDGVLLAPVATKDPVWVARQIKQGCASGSKSRKKKLMPQTEINCLAKFYRVQNYSTTWYPTSWGCCRVNQIRNECRCLHTSLRKSPNPTQSRISSYGTALHLSLGRWWRFTWWEE